MGLEWVAGASAFELIVFLVMQPISFERASIRGVVVVVVVKKRIIENEKKRTLSCYTYMDSHKRSAKGKNVKLYYLRRRIDGICPGKLKQPRGITIRWFP